MQEQAREREKKKRGQCLNFAYQSFASKAQEKILDYKTKQKAMVNSLIIHTLQIKHDS